jgi:4-amino-4-deoxy-L-arabinose transferase-like glycosyltransferase
MSDRAFAAVAGDATSRLTDAPSSRAALARKRLARAITGVPRRLPRAAWACALVAFLNAACWSLITPPFEAPDEPSHFAYVEELAEAGRLPSGNLEQFSPAEDIVLEDLRQGEVRYSPQNHTIFSATQQRQLQHDLALPLSRVSPNAGVAASEPPLYYALETIPYYAGSGGTLLDRLALMRLLSALIGACAVIFVFLFVRETLPGAPWAWIVASLGVAFAPLLGLMTGAVNSDVLLYTVSTALFYCLARGFRRGLTAKLGFLTGAVIAAGLLTKLNFIGLLPGAILGLLVLTVRARRTSGRSAYRTLAIALSTAAAPVTLYVVINTLTGRHAYGTLSTGASSTAGKGSLLHEIGYIWQFYLPPLPGMHDYFPGMSTTIKLWVNGFVGLYGWVDTVFPAWVYKAALIPVCVFAVLFASGLLANRTSLRSRLSELSVYAAMLAGLAALVGASDYLEYPTATGSYAQPRYLLPCLALYGAALAIAARGAGRRWGPVVGASLVILIIAHNTFSQLLEISRFYG